MHFPDLRRWIFIFLIFSFFADFSRAQRIFLPPTPDPSPPPTAAVNAQAPPLSPEGRTDYVLKTYPDGTRRIVPLEALNFHDDGAAFGGPPKLSLYEGPAPNPIALSQKSPERLALAPIGSEGAATSFATSLPASVDPMGGAVRAAAPADPLAGSPQKAAPPLQTVSGKPAPIVGDTTMLQLGDWESFFLNAGIGGSYQGQLTARRVDNGNNRQAYPYRYQSGAFSGALVGGENFTFNPGFRLDVEFGYNFYEWLGVGLQTGLIYNGINQYNVTFNEDAPDGLPNGSYNMSADGDLVQVPVQINGILRWPGQVKLRPFVGGGIGAVWQQLDVNNFYLANTDIQGNYCRSGFQFGWNAQAGLTYTFEPGLDFYGAFKLLSAFMPVIGNYQFSNTYNFAIEIGVQSRF